MVIPASSLEYLSVDVTASPAGVDLSGTPPEFAILPDTNRANPSSGDWLTGEWDDTTARILIGPAGGETALSRGDWHVWIRIDPPNDELIVRRAGTLTVV
ncbi:hypothetical protein ACTVZO_05405 [Streptomyces sp. IBSNAI002]|uniref:hypothetical protein n=1 Tax=Streptomyces sp. IBSNAI002 TaxID=3457500 RepID=UPI003FD537DE